VVGGGLVTGVVTGLVDDVAGWDVDDAGGDVVAAATVAVAGPARTVVR
jgi:hypothetical protein